MDMIRRAAALDPQTTFLLLAWAAMVQILLLAA